MKSITEQLAANKQLLSDLIQGGRMDEETTAKHMADGEKLAASGIALELRAEPRAPREFEFELTGVLSVEPA